MKRWWRRPTNGEIQRASREADRQHNRAHGQTPRVERTARQAREQARRASVWAELVEESWLRETR